MDFDLTEYLRGTALLSRDGARDNVVFSEIQNTKERQ